ncbi:MAG: hypothetical protein ACRBFS_19450 [Aureispira sp.]
MPLKWAEVAADCGAGTIWEVLEKSRSGAVEDVITGFSNLFFQRYKPLQRPFERIGSTYGKAGQINRGGWVGKSIKLRMIKGAKHVLSGVQLNFRLIAAGTSVSVHVYAANDLSTPIATKSVQITAPQKWCSVDFATPLEFNMEEYSDYYVVYQVPAGAEPLHNKSVSGCGNCGDNSIDNPYLDSLEVGGVDAVNLTDIKHINTLDGYGMILNASIQCDVSKWICSIASDISSTTYYALGGQMASAGMALAEAVMAASRVRLIRTILRTNRLNHLVLIDDNEILIQASENYKSLFENDLKLLVELYPPTFNECLVCSKGNTINRTSH